MNKTNHIIKAQGGFTLLEVLIAISIFAVGVLGATAMHGAASRSNLTGNVLTTAKSLAQDKIEEMKATGLPDLVTPDDSSSDDNPETLGDNFVRQWTVSDLTLSDGSVSSFARTIEVTVSWTKGDLTRSVTLASTTRGTGL